MPLDDRVVWFKACGPVQAFEPRFTADLFSRWPDRVSAVLGYNEVRGWLLLADAGTSVGALGNPPESWLAVLPRYAEVQRGEAAFVTDRLTHGVPDLRLAVLPDRYDELLRRDLPLDPAKVERLRAFAPRFAAWCADLHEHGIPDSVQHDDLHMNNLFEERNNLPPHDPWYRRLRDAYLEPWGRDLVATFDLAMRVGAFAHAIAWMRQRDALPEEGRPDFDVGFAGVVRRALACTAWRELRPLMLLAPSP